MNHLEQLIREWLEFRGFFVRTNVKVGGLKHGGYKGELDLVVYDPRTKRVLHLEPSIDSHTWKNRKFRFAKKFKSGKKYIPTIFPWIKKGQNIEQWAILGASPKNHKTIGGGRVISIEDLFCDIVRDIQTHTKSIPECYPLLRTIKLTEWCWGLVPDDVDKSYSGKLIELLRKTRK